MHEAIPSPTYSQPTESAEGEKILACREILSSKGRDLSASAYIELATVLPAGQKFRLAITCRTLGEPLHIAAALLGSHEEKPDMPSALLLSQLLAMLLPDARTGPIFETRSELAWRRVEPEAIVWQQGKARTPKLAQKSPSDARPHYALAALWPWNISRAMSAIAASGGGTLAIDISGGPADGHVSRTITALQEEVRALQYRFPETPHLPAIMAGVAALAQGVPSAHLSVAVGQMTLSDSCIRLVALSLFGSLAGTPRNPETPDLRGLVPLGHGPRKLLPFRTDVLVGERMSEPAPALFCDIVIGRTPAGRPITIGGPDRMRHTYVLGATGTGKSTLMRSMIAQDVAHGDCVILVDPHGDLSHELSDDLKTSGVSRLHMADASAEDAPFSIDLLPSVRNPKTREAAFDTFMGVFRTVLYDNREAFGPIFDQYFRNALFLVALSERPEAKLSDILSVFASTTFRRRLVENCSAPDVVTFWRQIAEHTNGEMSLANMAPYITSKLSRFIGSPEALRLFSPEGGGLDFAQAIERRDILILRLPKGEIGSGVAELGAALSLSLIAQAAMARSIGQRRPVRLYVDEMQACPGDTLSMLLAEGRKFGVSLTIANQSLSQVRGDAHASLANAALANAGNLLLFRMGAPDAMQLAPWLDRSEDWAELCRMPDFHIQARLLEQGRPTTYPYVRIPAPGAFPLPLDVDDCPF